MDRDVRSPQMEGMPQRASGPSIAPRMQYRSHPVSVAVDPVSLVISECISITSEIRKRAPSPHSSVSAILGGSPNPIYLGPPGSSSKGGSGGADGDSASAPASPSPARGSGLTNRWGLRGQKGKSMQDNPLMANFGRLRHELSGVKDIRTFDAPKLLYPFLQIIQTKGTAAAVTILALQALRKFLAYGFICPESRRFPEAMQAMSQALTHCHFSDSGQMEVVFLMILNLMEDMMSGPGGVLLSDESVCDMMSRGLAICAAPRFSAVLRQTAEASMVRMCQIIFEDVKHLEVEAGDDVDALDRKTDAAKDTLKMDPASDSADLPPPLEKSETQVESDDTAGPGPGLTGIEAGTETKAEAGGDGAADTVADSDPAKEGRGSEESGTSSSSKSRPVGPSDETDGTESLDLRPYSLPSVRELFRVLVSFLDPNEKQHSDNIRIMALRIIHVALEVSGPFIARHPALAGIAEDRLCSHLFRLVRSDNMDLLQESLVVASTLLATCRGVLKLQQELFLSYLVACLHPRMEIPREPGIDPSLYSGIPQAPKLVKAPPSQTSSGRSTPIPIKDRQKLGMEGGARKPDARQAMVECVGVLSRMPTFMAELFVNYDCDEDRADLCEDMVGLLSRNALPDSATWSTTSVPPLCLDALLRYVQFIAERLHQQHQGPQDPDPDALRLRRKRKKIIIKGATKFNESPKGGLGYLEAQGIIEDARSPSSVAKFLKGTSRVSKKVLGDFLSKRGNELILDAFMDLFDFGGKRIDEALRALLESFRLPGESPLIERIVTCFSEKYYENAMPAEVANKDAVFILTYAVIMLNTDQHNPNMKQKRMELEDFARNLRGQNDGQNFSLEFLQDIYKEIKSNEIILPDEHDNEHAFDYAWRELLLKADMAGELIKCDSNVYDADMFSTTWRPIVSTLAYVFMSASDDAVFARVVTGFDECARIATKYGVTEALDQIVYCLSHMTTIAVPLSFNTSLNTEVQAGDNSVMVSELAVKLGRDFRAQLAMLVLFRVVSGNEHMISRSWKHIIRIWLNLFSNSLIPPFFSTTHSDQLGIPPIPLQSPSHVVDRASKANETGFFSAFTSYITSYAADDPPEPSDEELESTLCAVDCVNQCSMGHVFARIANFAVDDLSRLVEALLHELPEDQDASVISVKAENVPLTPPTPPANGQKVDGGPLQYDAAVVYILEYCTVLALRDEATIEALGKQVTEALFAILRTPASRHSIIVSRATLYLLRLLQAGYDHDFVNVPILLHTLSSFPPDILSAAAPLILKGLRLCIDDAGPLRSEIMTSPDFWTILRSLGGRKSSSRVVFEILERGTSGNPPAIMADNYEAAISLLADFASASRHAVAPKSKPDAKGRKEVPAKKPPVDNELISRGLKAVTIIYSMTGRIPQLMKQSHLESSEGKCDFSPFCHLNLQAHVPDNCVAWSAYWLPIFKALTAQCTNPCRDVRHVAFSSLQKTLHSVDLTASDGDKWAAVFGKVLFPLILRLLKPEVFSSDRDGMSEMRVQAASLLCKVFLQYLVQLPAWEEVLELWIKIIDIMDRLMNSGQGDSLVRCSLVFLASLVQLPNVACARIGRSCPGKP